MKKPLNHAKFHNLIKGKFSLENYKNWKSSKTSENENILTISQAIKFANSNYVKYLNHLQSPYWKNIRQQGLLIDNNNCQSGKNVPAHEVHHLTYSNLEKKN